MSTALIAQPAGHYHFLKGIDPYSCGVIADQGFEVIRVVLAVALPWRGGFKFVESYLQSAGLGRATLCAMELRSPVPFTMAGFIEFNRSYRTLLEQWNLLVDDMNPMARTNVAPIDRTLQEVSLHAFSFVRPSEIKQRTFVVAGAGELREGILDSSGILRRGETSEEAILEKAGYVLDVMDARLQGLGVSWKEVTATNVYTVLPMSNSLREMARRRLQEAVRFGANWHWTAPPVVDIEFEMDLRGLGTELLG